MELKDAVIMGLAMALAMSLGYQSSAVIAQIGAEPTPSINYIDHAGNLPINKNCRAKEAVFRVADLPGSKRGYIPYVVSVTAGDCRIKEVRGKVAASQFRLKRRIIQDFNRQVTEKNITMNYFKFKDDTGVRYWNFTVS